MMYKKKHQIKFLNYCIKTRRVMILPPQLDLDRMVTVIDESCLNKRELKRSIPNCYYHNNYYQIRSQTENDVWFQGLKANGHRRIIQIRFGTRNGRWKIRFRFFLVDCKLGKKCKKGCAPQLFSKAEKPFSNKIQLVVNGDNMIKPTLIRRNKFKCFCSITKTVNTVMLNSKDGDTVFCWYNTSSIVKTLNNSSNVT